jgi:UDP-N-acetylmuramate--alanine ligase
VFGRLKRVHFVGIGGVGMSGIALVLKNLGFEVTGSDVKESDVTRRLADAGVRVFIGHAAENCADAQVVVYSSAVPSENPELEAARGRNVPVIRRAEMLAELMRMKYAVAISGSHGKTTVTSLVGHILERAGMDPTTVIGGRVLSATDGARLGQSEYLVAEADESDRSFLMLYPTVAVVTNIEREHLDVYHDLADIKREFTRFVNRAPFYGAVVLCTDSPAVRSIWSRVKRRVVTYGLDSSADFGARDVQLYAFSSAFTVTLGGREVGRFNLPMPGRHNVANALAAVAVASELGVDFDTMAAALRVFSGVHRRLEKVGEKNGVSVFDDYGHHPTEIVVTLEALRHAVGDRRVIVVFQPHRYTRTQLLAEEFAGCFDAADELVITRIYAASEPPIAGVDSSLIVRAIEARGKPKPIVEYVDDPDEVADKLAQRLKPGDVVITQGAGNICRIGAELLQRL